MPGRNRPIMKKALLPRDVILRFCAGINVSTVASIRSFPDAAYTASKGAVNSLTIHLAGRYGRYNIRANCMVLGYIDTPLARPAWDDEKVRHINLRQVPMKRFASPGRFEPATRPIESSITGVPLAGTR